MMCLKSVLIFLVLLPFPTAPPLFMILFVATMVHKLRPCVYCTVVLVLVFLSTCNNSFLSLSFPIQASNGTTIISLPPRTLSLPTYNSTLLSTNLNEAESSDELYYSAPARRCWCDLNSGRLLWPVLRGYSLVDEAKARRRKVRQAKVEEEKKARRLARKEQHESELLMKQLAEVDGSDERTASGRIQEGEEDLPELVLADEPERLDLSHLDESVSHTWIPLAPGEEEDDSLENGRRPTRTEHPEPQIEQEYGSAGSHGDEHGHTVAASATATTDFKATSFWGRLPWFLTSPRGGQLPAPSPASDPADSTDAAPPTVPQSPTDEVVPNSESDLSASDLIPLFAASPDKHWYTSYLPSSTRYDLRFHGIGVVFDFGFGRSEEAVRREVEEWIAWDEKKEARAEGEKKAARQETRGQAEERLAIKQTDGSGASAEVSNGVGSDAEQAIDLASDDVIAEVVEDIPGISVKATDVGIGRWMSFARKVGMGAMASPSMERSSVSATASPLEREL